MAGKKITVVGAGNVGETTSHLAALEQLGDIVLIDIVEGLAEGKALDLAQAGPISGYDINIIGTTDWEKAAGSDIVIITSGIPRKPGMSRDDLLAKNTSIVKSVTEQIVRYCPDSFIIVVCNPLDAMVYVTSKVSGFDKNKIMGMAGELDCARYKHFIASELNISSKDIDAVLMGGHGDDMVPLPRLTTVEGKPLTELLSKKKIEAIVERTRKGGIEVVNLLGYSAYYAPAAGAVKMAKAILGDNKSKVCCCAYCDKEYSAGGYFVGVPAILGKGGVEKIIELELNGIEQAAFEKSLLHVKDLSAKVDKLL
ncbi:MAG: malate dehydrogenase [Sedimentisphaerales bacterium]|nr:malate dehydrogenase [Sedimentisphaerales bacterium]